MELKEMIDELMSSKLIENQELATCLMRSDQMPYEEKKKHVDAFIADYNSGKVNFFSEERANLFAAWVELYQTTVYDDVVNRVKKIE